jgi:hypothetical protein
MFQPVAKRRELKEDGCSSITSYNVGNGEGKDSFID